MSDKKYPVKRGKEYELEIDKLAFGGFGVARIENYVIFVKDTLPGDRVTARIQKRKSSYAEARLISILHPSAQRREAPCPFFNWCGGCSWQNMTYQDQLEHKRKIVQESLERLGGIGKIETLPILPSEKIFAYRNKMEFSFSDRRWLLPDELGDMNISRDFALGLHVPGTFDKILHINNCLLQSETANQILDYISQYAQHHDLAPYGIKSHQGFLRFLVIRESSYTGKIMINIVTAFEDNDKLKLLAGELVKHYPQIGSVVNNINSRLAQTAIGEKEILLAGDANIQEKLGGFIFNISANSFFQTNTRQAEIMYEKVMEFAELDGSKVVWDLYSGTGTISLFLAQRAKTVIGFELVESAVKDARQNAKEHNVENVRFLGGDLLHKLKEVTPNPDVLVTDPPRAGMHEKVVRYINSILPERIVYISCNPTTLARDLAVLDRHYQIDAVQPVDMFPHTYHIETVVKLTRRNGGGR
jgi:23S rRNA (uracil1939-C5)-methyltransferase